jgi:hypothetical protein
MEMERSCIVEGNNVMLLVVIVGSATLVDFLKDQQCLPRPGLGTVDRVENRQACHCTKSIKIWRE